MGAPLKGLSREAFNQYINDYIDKKCKTKEGQKMFFCQVCDSKIQQTTCFVSIHLLKESGCKGPGKVVKLPLPYCPLCEGEPKNTSTCVHV